MNTWCTDFTSSVLWVLKSGFHQPSQAGGEETLMCKKRQSEKRERSWQSQSFQTCSAHIWSILSLINRSGPMLRCTAANPKEFQHTARLKWAPHTPLLSSTRWLSEWLTHSLTHTNSWRFCLPTGVQYYRSTHAPLLIFENREPLCISFSVSPFIPCTWCKWTLCHSC